MLEPKPTNLTWRVFLSVLFSENNQATIFDICEKIGYVEIFYKSNKTPVKIRKNTGKIHNEVNVLKQMGLVEKKNVKSIKSGRKTVVTINWPGFVEFLDKKLQEITKPTGWVLNFDKEEKEILTEFLKQQNWKEIDNFAQPLTRKDFDFDLFLAYVFGHLSFIIKIDNMIPNKPVEDKKIEFYENLKTLPKNILLKFEEFLNLNPTLKNITYQLYYVIDNAYKTLHM
jgi:predicted transcriptional regulator